MSLKWKTAILFFITSLVLIPVSVEYLLQVESTKIKQKQITAQQQMLEQWVALPEIVKRTETIQQLIASQESLIQDLVNNNQPISEPLIFSNNNGFLISLIILLITFGGYLIGRRIAYRVDEVILGISKAGSGNYNQRILASGQDEVSQLVASYNRMLDNLSQSSQENKEQLQKYTSILNRATLGIVSINERGVIEEYNQSAEAIFGYLPEEIISKNITKLIPTRIPQINDEVKEQSFIPEKGSTTGSNEVIGIRKNGQNFPLELSVIESAINNAVIYTGIICDLSERRESENKKLNLEMQLRKLQRQNSLESLSGGIAHDFNNILGPVLGYADMAIAEAEEGTKLHKYLVNILGGAHRARELVARIMSFNRQTEHSNEHIHLTRIVEDALALITSSVPSEHKIKTYFNTTNDAIAADKTQLSQVLMALVTNASQAMANNTGTLTIRLDNIIMDEALLAKGSKLKAGEYVQMRVQDTGVGIDNVTLSRIFEPFFSTRDTKEGSGLGLGIAYGIVKSFGGEIIAESKVNEGSTFSVFLPVDDPENKNTNAIGGTKLLSKGGELILYIDDDEFMIELGKEMLENLGYEVATSISSEKALQMFRDDPEDFDLVITDQSMPVLTGTQLARELKRIRSDIPVILVSGFSAAILSHELVDSGIEHCIAKPVVMDELARVVLEALSTSLQK